MKRQFPFNFRTLIAIFLVVPCFSIVLALAGTRINARFFLMEGPLDEVDNLIKQSNDNINQATEVIKGITDLKTQIEKGAALKKANSSSNQVFDTLRLYLDLNVGTLLEKIKKSGDDLSDKATKIDDLIGRIKTSPANPGNEPAIAKLTAQKKLVTDKNSEVTTNRTGLNEPVNNVYKAIETIADDSVTQVQKLTSQSDTSTNDELLKFLPTELPVLSANVDWQKNFKKIWPDVQKQLIKIVPSPITDPTLKLKLVDDKLTAILGKLEKWIATLTTGVEDANDGLLKMRASLDADLTNNSVKGLQALDKAEANQKTLAAIIELLEIIAKNSEIKALGTGLTGLKEKLPDYKARTGMVREGLAGDFNHFVNDFVPLYYFTDVFNLMKVLNSNAQELKDVSALRTEANNARKDVNQADLNLSLAQAKVSGLQTKLRNLRNELKQAENDLSSANDLLAQATKRFDRFGADDPKNRAAKERKAELTTKQEAAQSRFDSLADEEKGLPPQIRTAEDQLLEAQTAVQTTRSSLILLAQNESVAFAQARDNEPVYLAKNDVTSKDPIKQIIIYAFGNRKILYLRGTKYNVDKAKNIIAFFDRPAPQARLALWSLELNSQATKSGAQEFSDSLVIVENQLSNTRAQIAAVLAHLRQCINQKVNSLSESILLELRAERSISRYQGPKNDLDDTRWARSFFYQDEVLKHLGFDPDIGLNGKTSGVPIFDRQGSGAIKSSAQPNIVSRNSLPDPVSAGTLGEALIILSLAKPEFRDQIMKDFTDKVGDEMAKVRYPLPRGIEKNPQNTINITPDSFNLTKRALDVGSTTSYTALQQEIVSSITLASVPRLLKRLKLFDFSKDIKMDKTAQDGLVAEIKCVLDFLWNNYGISTTDLFGADIESDDAAQRIVNGIVFPENDGTVDPKKGGIVDPKKVEIIPYHVVKTQLSKITTGRNIYRLANAQIAKTDNMIKQLIDAFDEDINRNIIQPTVYDMRANLVNRRIGVGIINRTSVLATNRLVARVDPRSSAQLSVGEEQDALLAAQQLANLFLAAKTGGLLGGLTGLQSTQQQKETSEVYGVNSGSVFKVTPVFDPTGQALRFQFDHVQANLVTEPNGSIQPALPRIERHTINTEVQLNNLELREISRFESNAKIGIPTTYKGGVPIFRDIPYVNKVPLLGWFVRRSGKAAVIQQSLVLGQTTMYPTIADIFDLLSGDDYNLDEITGTSDIPAVKSCPSCPSVSPSVSPTATPTP